MISSMTGYANRSQSTPDGTLTLELRAVNNRFLDIQLRLPDDFRALEPKIREHIAQQLSRGKIECRLNFTPHSAIENPQALNSALLQKLLELNTAVKTSLPETAGLSVAEILNWPGMLGNNTLSTGTLHQSTLTLLQAVLPDLKAARMREGEKLQAVLLERVTRMRQHVAAILPRIPALIAAFEEKLSTRLQEALNHLDDERIRQEITIYAAKIDIDEELSRLQTHLDEVERILNTGGTVGKRLDFLMQELNREANTIGSKSVDIDISKIAMELKVLIEQMREQVQNIE
ncbi:TIGR00255 family protein [Nitrosomonas sp. Nm51]|uniref:YicC/YloC family endoribonuclease n=1 Tax=Nitrosomonas sp. Nm51 TaxID=133720 RepID=UPI0008D32B14|nr:YicC/YloC family endoribonuclease [Nitrosomonas sp. Nm51]SER13140.1 TIGR00255 family protein [Nitrosomonas sp. Nm51]